MAGADPFAPAPPPASCWLQVCSMQDQGQDPGRVRQHNLRMGDSLAPQSTQFCPAEQRASAGGEGERLAAELQVYLELTTIRDKLKEQLQVLTAEEDHIQQLARETTEREETLKSREEALTHREEALTNREVEVSSREDAVSVREEALVGREERVREMERLACEAYKSVVRCIEQEVSQRVEETMVGQREEVGRAERCLKEKSREVQRLRQCYEAVKQSNDSLRKQLQEAQEKRSGLEAQLSSSQSRLASLQRKNEQLVAARRQWQLHVTSVERQVDASSLQSASQLSKSRNRRHTPRDSAYYDLLGGVLSWLCSAHLSQPLTATQQAAVQHTSCRILPSVAALLPQVPSLSVASLQLPVLQFVYWCVTHMNTQKQKSTITSTLRRIGEAVYKPVISDVEEMDGQKPQSVGTFFTSSDCHTRTLSCLLILRTVTQVDSLARVFEQLQQALTEDKAKQVFLAYRGVDCVLPFMKASSRVLCTHAVDTYLTLSVESVMLPQFLCALSTERWLSACVVLLREASDTDTATLEKISILLQRLSKIKGNHSLFESQRVSVAVQEVLRRSQAGSPDSASFLSLNLQSTLVNLTRSH